MRVLHLTLAVAMAAGLALPLFETSAAFARAAGTAGAPGGPGGSSGSSGGSAGGGAGGGGSPAPRVAFDREPPPRFRPVVSRPHVWGSCFKQDHLYDRYGYAVLNIYGADCVD